MRADPRKHGRVLLSVAAVVMVLSTAALTSASGAVPGAITTLSGRGSFGYDGDGGLASEAVLGSPFDAAFDAAGNLYLVEFGTNRIRRIDANGVITTVVGDGRARFFGDGGPATQASLHNPEAVLFAPSGEMYIADSGNSRVRKVDVNGIITTVAGNGSYGYDGDGGPAKRAQLAKPAHIALDAQGNLYIADNGNYRIRKVDANGTISTVAGTGSDGFSGDGGPATAAALKPHGMVFDAEGNLYFSDSYNHRIRKIDPNGIITTVAGNGSSVVPLLGVASEKLGTQARGRTLVPGVPSTLIGDGGNAPEAALAYPLDLQFDAAGNLYVTDSYTHRIRRIGADGTITTVAGGDWYGYAGDGGPATQAALARPSGMTLDPAGNLYIADTFNQRLRRVDAPLP